MDVIFMKILENYFNVSLIPDYCTEEKLNKFYGYYLHNLKTAPYKTMWVTLDEIEEREINNWLCIGDKFLEDSANDRNKLALDIYKNGTYFPLFVLKREGLTLKIRDGIHRIYCMRKLVEKGLWKKDRKVLVATDELTDDYYPGKNFIFYIPIVVAEDFKQNYSFIYRDIYESKLIYADKEKEFVEYRTKKKGYLTSVCISLLIRNALFEFKQKNGYPIKPSPIINDYNKWKEWRGY
jgi:hypothetical protein